MPTLRPSSAKKPPRLTTRHLSGAVVLCGVLGVLGSPLHAAAQSTGEPARPVRAPQSANAAPSEAIALRVQPAVGDVLRLEMQQVLEMVSSRREGSGLPDVSLGGASERAERPVTAVGPRRNASPARVTIMDLYAHTVVERSDAKGAVLASSTDSMVLRAGEVGQTLVGQSLPVPESERTIRFLVEPNGTIAMLDSPSADGAVGATLAAMPAMLPDEAVLVGAVWERDVALPALPIATYRTDGVLHATFRLDSLARGGRDAYVSVVGELRRDGAARDLPLGSRVVTAGTMRGTLVLDRVRGWIIDARTVIDVRSEVLTSENGGSPMAIELRITQRMRVR